MIHPEALSSLLHRPVDCREDHSVNHAAHDGGDRPDMREADGDRVDHVALVGEWDPRMMRDSMNLR